MKKSLKMLSLLAIVLTVVATSIGLFYHTDGQQFTAQNVHGDTIKIFGEGIYEKESYFKAPIHKGTDSVVLFIIIPLFILSVLGYNHGKLKMKLLHLGLLSCLLYYSASVAFGATYNSLFMVYLILFSTCLFAIISAIQSIDTRELESKMQHGIPHKGLIVFLLLAGCSVFVWLIEILNALKTGMPPSIIGMSSTEPTFVLDIGVIAPVAFYTAYLIYKGQSQGYIYGVMLLTLNAAVGLIVIGQTIFQYSYGIFLSAAEFIPYVMVFTIMSGFAIFLDIKIFTHIKDKMV